MNHLGVWAITIGGYGSFEYVGTEIEAQDMLSHKVVWEGSTGMKSRLRDASELELFVWKESGGPFSIDSDEKPRAKKRAKKKQAKKKSTQKKRSRV